MEICIYDHDKERGKTGKSYQDIIAISRRNSLAITYNDDAGQPLVGQSDPRTVRIDGPRLYVDVHFKLEDHHKVEKLLQIRDADPAALAEVARVRKVVAEVKSDDILALNTMVGEGRTDDEVLAKAAELGVNADAAPLILKAIRDLRHASIEDTGIAPKGANHSIGGEVGGSEVTGDTKVNASISGTVAAKSG